MSAAQKSRMCKGPCSRLIFHTHLPTKAHRLEWERTQICSLCSAPNSIVSTNARPLVINIGETSAPKGGTAGTAGTAAANAQDFERTRRSRRDPGMTVMAALNSSLYSRVMKLRQRNRLRRTPRNGVELKYKRGRPENEGDDARECAMEMDDGEPCGVLVGGGGGVDDDDLGDYAMHADDGGDEQPDANEGTDGGDAVDSVAFEPSNEVWGVVQGTDRDEIGSFIISADDAASKTNAQLDVVDEEEDDASANSHADNSEESHAGAEEDAATAAANSNSSAPPPTLWDLQHPRLTEARANTGCIFCDSSYYTTLTGKHTPCYACTKLMERFIACDQVDGGLTKFIRE